LTGQNEKSGHVCPWWLAYSFDNPLRRIFHKPEKIFASMVRPGMTVADIGCGMGYFSLGLARMVTETGKVIAVDIQEKMLLTLEKRAKKHGLSSIITTGLCPADNITVSEPTDFVLAFWVVHETPDKKKFLEQLHAIVKPRGLLLITEPKFHVSRDQFEQEVSLAQAAGFIARATHPIALSHAILFEKG
jgi:ubiquinone/menaquinone biosynthesis C-methylase UbiE